MICFIYGDHGHGKTFEMISRAVRDAESGKKVLLIVPEQFTVITERKLLENLSARDAANAEVLNFSRLANETARRFGGLVFNYASPGVRRVAMRRALRKAAPFLREYPEDSASDRGTVIEMLKLADEFGSCGITPEQLEKARESASGSLRDKLADFGTVLAFYSELLSENFSDPARDLDRLADLENPGEYFGELNVYIDSFSGFTGVEHRIVAMIMKSAENVCISVPLPGPLYCSADTVSLRKTSDRLRADAAASGRKTQTVMLDGAKRFASRDLALVAGSLWDPAAEPSDVSDGGIRLISSPDAYDESEACAAGIRALVEKGFRYRDFAVIARSASDYRGIVDRAFEDAGIPLFFSEKISALSSAPVRFLLSSIRIPMRGWQAEDVISLVKTGLCGFEEGDADLFEIYVEKWKVGGSRFTGEDWTMNPDGYIPEQTERQKNILERVNRVRRTLVSSVSVLSEKIAGATDAASLCTALYDYACGFGIEEKIRRNAEKRLAEGRAAESEALLRSWSDMIEGLNQFFDAYSGGEVPDLSETYVSLELIYDSITSGSIPLTSDAAVFGSADMLRTDNPRFVFLLGVCDGSFPAPVKDGGLLSETERATLCDGGLPLSGDGRSGASDELYFFRRALSAASDGAVLFTRPDVPSVPVGRITTLLPVAPERSDADLTERIFNPVTAAKYRRLLADTPAGDALKALLSAKATPSPDEPLTSLSLALSTEAARALSPKKLVLSNSKFETYSDCPFKYYCKYALKLSEDEAASFSGADTGTYVHHLLEKYFSPFSGKSGKLLAEITPEERRRRIDGITSAYVTSVFGEKPGGSAGRIVRKMSALGDAIIRDVSEELSRSDFRPEFFELEIGRGGITPLSFDTSDGGSVSVEGRIDRVDVYRSGGTSYIRTVDYKTGKLDFSVDGVMKGETVQLLLYLFSITRGSDPGTRAVFGGEPKEAAAEYVVAKIKAPVLHTCDPDETVEQVSGLIGRRGVILDSEEIMNAVSSDGSPKILMKPKKGRSPGHISGERFDEIFSAVRDCVRAAADGIKSGNASATPSHDACEYCGFANVCRSSYGMRGTENVTGEEEDEDGR